MLGSVAKIRQMFIKIELENGEICWKKFWKTWKCEKWILLIVFILNKSDDFSTEILTSALVEQRARVHSLVAAPSGMAAAAGSLLFRGTVCVVRRTLARNGFHGFRTGIQLYGRMFQWSAVAFFSFSGSIHSRELRLSVVQVIDQLLRLFEVLRDLQRVCKLFCSLQRCSHCEKISSYFWWAS